MHFYRIYIEVFVALFVILVEGIPLINAVRSNRHQKEINKHNKEVIEKQEEEIKAQKKAIGELKKEIEEQRRETQERRIENQQLQQDKAQYQKDIGELKDVKNIKSLQLVQWKLEELKPPLCDVCKQLLTLRVATTLNGATQPFVELGKVGESNPRLKVDRRVLNALENAITGSLWQIPLSEDRPPENFIRQAIKTYSKLVSNLRGEELDEVIRFCTRICLEYSGLLQREAVLRLLPTVLVASDGAKEVMQVYRKLLEELANIHRKEKLLLGAIFGSLVDAISVRSANITEIWRLAFGIVKSDVEWAWGQKDGLNVGGPWCIAMGARLQYADEKEKKALRDMISDYLILDKARFHQLSYHPLSHLLGGRVRKEIDKTDPGYREVNRAVVLDMEIRVEISLVGSPTAIMGRLVNFSLKVWKEKVEGLEVSNEKVAGIGVWATTPDRNQTLQHELMKWHDATVNILYPMEGGPIVFKSAKVWPSEEKANNREFWGFRIQLGPSLPEDGVAALIDQWKDPKR